MANVTVYAMLSLVLFLFTCGVEIFHFVQTIVYHVFAALHTIRSHNIFRYWMLRSIWDWRWRHICMRFFEASQNMKYVDVTFNSKRLSRSYNIRQDPTASASATTINSRERKKLPHTLLLLSALFSFPSPFLTTAIRVSNKMWNHPVWLRGVSILFRVFDVVHGWLWPQSIFSPIAMLPTNRNCRDVENGRREKWEKKLVNVKWWKYFVGRFLSKIKLICQLFASVDYDLWIMTGWCCQCCCGCGWQTYW